MNKPHLPTREEIIKNLAAPIPYVHIELSPDTIRERAKKHHEMSQLEREARILDTYKVMILITRTLIFLMSGLLKIIKCLFHQNVEL